MGFLSARRASRPVAGGGWLAAGPDAVEGQARHVTADGWHGATLAVTSYPAEVGPGWLEPLASYLGQLDVSLHIEPVPAPVAAGPLRR